MGFFVFDRNLHYVLVYVCCNHCVYYCFGTRNKGKDFGGDPVLAEIICFCFILLFCSCDYIFFLFIWLLVSNLDFVFLVCNANAFTCGGRTSFYCNNVVTSERNVELRLFFNQVIYTTSYISNKMKCRMHQTFDEKYILLDRFQSKT